MLAHCRPNCSTTSSKPRADPGAERRLYGPCDHFLRGDVAAADPSVDHCPVADPGEDCYCFAVNDAPIRLTRSLSRFLNPFIRI
jgi:anti-sigma factor ChrR (cupin superfamily)